jgi:hypothetical protein
VTPTSTNADTTTTSTPAPSSDTPTGAIIGAVVGGLLGIAAITAIAVVYLKKQKYKRERPISVVPSETRSNEQRTYYNPYPPTGDPHPIGAAGYEDYANNAYKLETKTAVASPQQEVWDSEPSGRLRYE